MAFTPDVIVTTDYSPATIALVAEAKEATGDLDEIALPLKHYMLQMGCSVGMILTPQILRIYKDRFLGRSEDSIQLVGDFPSRDLLKSWQSGAGAESALKSVLIQWLDELTTAGQVQVSDPNLKLAIDEYILPAISGGRVSIAQPGTLQR
jgi:hypothetical protein